MFEIVVKLLVNCIEVVGEKVWKKTSEMEFRTFSSLKQLHLRDKTILEDLKMKVSLSFLLETPKLRSHLHEYPVFMQSQKS